MNEINNEEDFLSLLEESLTDEAFLEYSKDMDDFEEEIDASKSVRLAFSEEFMISITSFVKDYLGFDFYKVETKENPLNQKGIKQDKNFKTASENGTKTPEIRSEDLIAETTATVSKAEYRLDLYHSGLKEFDIPYVIGVSHEYANAMPEYVLKGFLLLVIDAKGHYKTYLNPIMVKEYIERDITFAKYKSICEQPLTTIEEQNEHDILKAKVDRINEFHDVLYETHRLRQVLRIQEEQEKKKSK